MVGTMKTKIRIQLDMGPAEVKRLDQTVILSEGASRSEVIRRAVELYCYLTEQRLKRPVDLGRGGLEEE